jgi:hypothetical protein
MFSADLTLAAALNGERDKGECHLAVRRAEQDLQWSTVLVGASGELNYPVSVENKKMPV